MQQGHMHMNWVRRGVRVASIRQRNSTRTPKKANGVIYSNDGDGGTGITSPGMGMQRGQAPTNAHAKTRPAEWSGANEGRGSSNAVEYGEDACMAPANAGAANLAIIADEGERSGAPHRCNGGTVLHPGAIAFNAAIWEQLGDPYDAFALGGG